MGILICPAFFLPIIPIAIAFWCYHQQNKEKSDDSKAKKPSESAAADGAKSSTRESPPTKADSPKK